MNAYDPAQLLADASRGPWPAQPRGTCLSLGEVTRLLPHRPPFRFVDRAWVDAERIVAVYDLAAQADIFAAHFPALPRWPGVLQIEAIAQAGLLQHAWRLDCARDELALTHVLGARFVRSVLPGAPITVVARTFEDGLFTVSVGQVLQEGALCSAAVTCVL
jgi:3-hydroxyacyl-[acyl-carrier-protein] dehydratase